MSHDLKVALTALMEELNQHPQLNDEEQAALARLAIKIKDELSVIEDPNHPQEKIDLGSQSGDLEVFMTKFHVEHPALTKVLKRVVDGLSGMGI